MSTLLANDESTSNKIGTSDQMIEIRRGNVISYLKNMP